MRIWNTLLLRMPVSVAHTYIALINLLCEHGSAFFSLKKRQQLCYSLKRKTIQPRNYKELKPDKPGYRLKNYRDFG
jgi:hypothetical protein